MEEPVSASIDLHDVVSFLLNMDNCDQRLTQIAADEAVNCCSNEG